MKKLLTFALFTFGAKAALLGNISNKNFSMEVLMQDFTRQGEVLVDIGFSKGNGESHERNTMFLLDVDQYNDIFNSSKSINLTVEDNMSEQTFITASGSKDNRNIKFDIQSNPGVNFIVDISINKNEADIYMEMYRRGFIFNSTRSENLAEGISFIRDGINMYNIDNQCVGNVNTKSALKKAASKKTEDNFIKNSNNECR